MNTDEPETIGALKAALATYGAVWTQAKRESIGELIKRLRIRSYPTTLLVGPDGKILSLNNTDKNELSLRGQELLKSLATVMRP